MAGTAALLTAGATGGATSADYNPSVRGPQSAAADRQYDVVVTDAARSRDIPVLIRHSARRMEMPVVIYSHGLGGSRLEPEFLARHWVARGYVAVFIQHPGSDDAVWRDLPPARRMAALQAAATFENLVARMRDVVAVLDALARWKATDENGRPGRYLDLARIGMSGHSFGGTTTQAVSGQSVPSIVPGTWPDPRIRAALVMSPSPPRNMAPDLAFGRVAIPWMVMTGTHDGAVVGNATAADRLVVYPALPPGRKYELVLDQAEHSAFGSQALPMDQLPRNPNHPRVILALSTAFWDAHLMDNTAAQAWLTGDGPRTVLQPADRWQTK